MKVSTLPAPQRPQHLSQEAQWLSGEGAGSWFEWQLTPGGLYEINRYSPEGILECGGLFKAENTIEGKGQVQVTYPSHCQQVTWLQKGIRIVLTRQGDATQQS